MIELLTLGEAGIRTRGAAGATRHRLLSQPKAFALLAYLAAHEPFVRRDQVLAMFWPKSDEAHARNLLSKMLRRLAECVGQTVVEARGPWDIGAPDHLVWCDARALGRAAEVRDDAAAVELFRGEFLDGWHVAGLSEFSHWMETERLRLRQAAVQAGRRLASARAATGDLDGAIAVLRRSLALGPANEVVTRELMALLERQGDGAAALEIFAETSSWLTREVGAPPAQATLALADAIRARTHAIASIVPASPTPAPAPAAKPGGRRTTGLAVLPLDNLTGDRDLLYLVDGVTDALTTQLARMSGVRVISRLSTLRYRNSQQPLATIARDLGVDALVHGAVTRSEDRIRVTVQLVFVDPERHVWAGAFERAVRDVPGLQSAVSRVVAREFSRVVEGASVERPAPPEPARVAPAAYEAYLKARFHSAMLTDIPRAITCFHEAAALDPDFVPAWAGLAMAYANLAMFVYLPPGDALPEVARAAARAIELDPRAGEAYIARGLWNLLGDWDWPAAAQDFDHAVSLSPGAVEPRIYRALWRSAMGDHDRALTDARWMLELDPLGPGTRLTVALCHYKAGRFDESARTLGAALELYPAFAPALPLLAASHALAGRAEQAIDAARLCVTHLPDDQQGLAYAAAALGRSAQPEEARQVLDRLLELDRSRYVDPWAVAVGYCGLGCVDDALAWLRRLRERRSPSAFCVKSEPFFAALRSRQEYREIVDRLRFT